MTHLNTSARRLALAAAPCLAIASGADAQVAYAWANEPAAAKYAPDRSYAFHPTGGEIIVRRDDVGRYTVRFSGLGDPPGGDGEGPNGDSGDGTRTHPPEMLDRPAVERIDPSVLEPLRETPDIDGLRIAEPDRADGGGDDGRDGGHAQVSAYGTDASFCTVASWRTGGFDVNVRCFDADGRPADSRFVVMAGWPRGMAMMPMTITPSTVDDLQSEIFNLRDRVSQLESELEEIGDGG